MSQLLTMVAVLLLSSAALAGGGGEDLMECRNAASRAVVGDAYLTSGEEMKEVGIDICENKFPNGCTGGCLACVNAGVLKVSMCIDRNGNQINIEH